MATGFYLDQYIEGLNVEVQKGTGATDAKRARDFEAICNDVLVYFNDTVLEKELQGQDLRFLERQKKAIIGVENEVNYFKSEIKNYLTQHNLMGSSYPTYYRDLIDAIYHNNWGLAGIAAWKELPDSSSAKIIGGQIYFLVDGKMQKQEQSMSTERFQQLKKALLLDTPLIKSNLPYYELYMNNGERITIFTGELTKKDQDIMVFRKYLVEEYDFQELAKRKTIPYESIPMFESMAQVGFNVFFSGAVGSGKTTFMSTWQSLEDPSLEGVMVETDPEIPIHQLMPGAPIMQLIADGDGLQKVVKNLMRSDADYLIMAESRDGFALGLAIEMANKGTRRSKTTTHLTDIEDLCYDVAQKIVTDVGGNLDYTIMKVAKSVHYIVELVKLPNKSEKRLKGVYEVRYDKKTYGISIRQIMKYDFLKDDWSYAYDIGVDKEQVAMEENYEAFKEFQLQLQLLENHKKMDEDGRVMVPFYSKMIQRSLMGTENVVQHV